MASFTILFIKKANILIFRQEFHLSLNFFFIFSVKQIKVPRPIALGGKVEEFVEKIIKTLNAHGFPSKRVSLPVEKMYEAADNRGLNFNKVLEHIEENLSIGAEIQTEKIVFYKIEIEQEALASDNPFANPDMIKKAQEMMSKMSSEELQQMQQMFQNMSDTEKEDLMKKGRELGLI